MIVTRGIAFICVCLGACLFRAWAANPGAARDHSIDGILLLVLGALVMGCCFWAFAERARASVALRSLEELRAHGTALRSLRDAVLAACHETILIAGPHSASFKDAAGLIDACKGVTLTKDMFMNHL